MTLFCELFLAVLLVVAGAFTLQLLVRLMQILWLFHKDNKGD